MNNPLPYRMIALILVTCSAAQCFSTNAFAFQAKTKAEIAEICSIFESPAANAQAWERGDFLVREHDSFDNVVVGDGSAPKGVIFERETLTRVIFDYPSRKYAYFSLSTSSTIDVSETDLEGNSIKHSQSKLTGWCSDHTTSKVFQLKTNRERSEKDRSEFEEDEIAFLRKIGFPDFRGFWLSSQSYAGKFYETVPAAKSFAFGKNFVSKNTIGDNAIELVFRIPNSDAFRSYTFDVITSMPMSYKDYGVMDDGTVAVGPTAKLQWTQLKNHIYVLKSAQASEYTSREFLRDRHTGTYYRDYDFHWFSLNEKVDDHFFDGTQLADRDVFLSHVDPVKAGATELIDKSNQGSSPSTKSSGK